ncbi:CATRA conflict system CASPASE/TPR repeat-associated protein [Kitasatospora phosalacinea]|uniref:CATRA conflict system CASPASE/TPR repeat-associated protein n=1 Tax=Kitasatospora phosalacinea TaxID=2065 RepID=A0ABW6GEY2_9ACTN
MTALLDQQLVVHLYAPTDGPDAEAARRGLADIWRGCRTAFGMTDPVPGTGLPHLLPADLFAAEPLPAPPQAPLRVREEFAVAAQERAGTDCQAVLRRHHDVWNLSVALSPQPGGHPPGPGWWAGAEDNWQALSGRWNPHLLGRSLIRLARVDAVPAVLAADPGLAERFGPARAGAGLPLGGALAADGPLALWEGGDGADERAERRFLLALAPGADARASAWVWSRGDTAIPPLARYLLHAAKLRHQLRVWQRDGRTRAVRTALDGVAAELRRLGADDAVLAELLRLRRLEALLLHGDLRELRRTVEIAADNLGRSVGPELPSAATGPFAEDADLARSLLERLDDELAYLGVSVDRAAHLERPPAPSTGPPATASAAPEAPAAAPPERSREVFVVHGRDEPSRRAVFAFLRALGLRPLEWEELVARTGQSSPYLGETVARAMPLAQAVVVVLTPEDVVRLHPELAPGRDPELRPALQPRPNVLLELGMALAVHPDRTVILLAGEQRPVTDLGGRNYVRLTGGPECRSKIAGRLRLAGCPVDTSGQDWLRAGDFAALAALHREVPG